ncbi:hypothetical protein GBA52_001752 [Prunus armeniaca]|nr:hypothetical protein GBA52_001752 [Prunus armeniaca]
MLRLSLLQLLLEPPLLPKAKSSLMVVPSFATDNHCLEMAIGQLHGSRHSVILMELRDTIQSDAAMDHIMPRHECIR